jgi:U3 small nucleolar RNA-associated protein 16
MVRTRSHKTFDEENEEVNISKGSEISTLKTVKIDDIDSKNDTDDSDDAPEEESVSISRKNMIEKQKDQAKIMKKKRDEAKAKHKEIEERRKIAKLEKELKQLEQQKRELDYSNDEIPNELPEYLLETFDSSKQDNESTSKSKKIVFVDKDEEHKLDKASKRKIREERLKKLREIKYKTEKEVDGGIHVKILNKKSKNCSNNVNQIVSKKSEWLMRKRIRRN